MTIGISEISSLGTVFDEENVVDNRIISIPRPLGTTSNNTAINLTGKVRTITITGSQSGQGYAGASVDAKLKAFIADVELWINPDIQTASTYTDSFGNTYSVLCTNFRWTRISPGTRILYVFVLVEGGALSAFS